MRLPQQPNMAAQSSNLVLLVSGKENLSYQTLTRINLARCPLFNSQSKENSLPQPIQNKEMCSVLREIFASLSRKISLLEGDFPL